MNPHANPYRPSPFAPEVYEDERKQESLAEELAALRDQVRNEGRALRSAMSRPRVPAELTAEIATLRAAVDELLAAPGKKGDSIAAMLRSRGIEGPAAAAIARVAKAKKLAGKDDVEKIRLAIGALVRIGTFPIAEPGKSVVALVGPAGVGKTTTAAKLAARARMAKKSIALVSCDAFRVGAIEQFGKYAELLDARFHAVSTPEELIDVARAEIADIIIVDTSGRPVEHGSVEAALGSDDLRDPERIGRRVEVILCAPASLRSVDAARVVTSFAVAAPTALAITKLDETEAPSGIVHASFATKLPIGTLTNGQRVPEDIAPATIDAIMAALEER